jgi:hypothetical protein
MDALVGVHAAGTEDALLEFTYFCLIRHECVDQAVYRPGGADFAR